MSQVCDQPHPAKVTATIDCCLKGDLKGACGVLSELHASGGWAP